MMNKILSLIVVSYKNINVLRDCLDSIHKYNDIGDALEVIVSDNSPDLSLYDCIQKEYPWVKILKNENRGFGAGNNRGVEISSGQFLLFLNPDTILVEPIFKFAIEKFCQDPKLSLFGLQLVDGNRKKNYSYGLLWGAGISAAVFHKFCHSFGIYIDGKMFISGADLFVRRESFIECGGFDENIFMYREESDLILRIKKKSQANKTKFFKQKKLIHLEGGTQSTNSDGILQAEHRSIAADKYYCEKYNLNFKKLMKQKIRKCKLKLLFSIIARNKDVAELQKQTLGVYRAALQ